MPFYQIITRFLFTDSEHIDVEYIFANTLRRAVISLTNMKGPYQSYDSIDQMSDEALEKLYKSGYVSPDKSLLVQICQVYSIPVVNVENNLVDNIELIVPKKPLKSTVWKNFMVKPKK